MKTLSIQKLTEYLASKNFDFSNFMKQNTLDILSATSDCMEGRAFSMTTMNVHHSPQCIKTIYNRLSIIRQAWDQR